VADSSTESSSNAVVIPVLEGQTCIGELIPDFKRLFGVTPPEWDASDGDGPADGQLKLF
jgi:hypothetical protein